MLPGHLTPSLLESAAHLGTWLPFDKAVQELRFFTQVEVSEPTLRRHVEAAGAAYVALQDNAVAVIKRDLPPAPPGPDVQQMSVDGAMIPLLHGEWAEVRTLALGVVEKPVLTEGAGDVHTRDVSYFSRLCDAATFGDLALVETHRRGTECAKTVCAVVDGAEWEQGFIDLHRPDAIRILDFPHAGEYVAAAGQVIYGQDTEPVKQWLAEELHRLKNDCPQVVLADLRGLAEMVPADGHGADDKKKVIRDSIGYLDKRKDQMHYADYIAKGYPIGSGMVESGNKVVVEARMKGAGMHWQRAYVNPMLALRNVACSDRWTEAWPQVCQRLRMDARTRRRDNHKKRQERTQGDADTGAHAMISVGHRLARTEPSQPFHISTLRRGESGPSDSATRRPAANHPWRHAPIGRARGRYTGPAADAKV